MRFSLKQHYCWLTGIAFFIGTSCHSEKKREPNILEGDLFFKSISFNFFELPDTVLTRFEKQCSGKTGNGEGFASEEPICFLVRNSLLRKPYKRIRFANAETAILYLSKADYNRLDAYNLADLRQENKKVSIKAAVVPFKINDSLTIYSVSDLIAIRKVTGKTYLKK